MNVEQRNSGGQSKEKETWK